MTNYTTLSDSELTEALNFHRRQRNMSRGINEAAHARQTQMVRMLEAEEARRLEEAKTEHPVKTEYKALMKHPIEHIKGLYKAGHKVSDTSGVSKSNLVTDYLRSKHGDAKVNQAFGLKEALEEASKPNQYIEVTNKFTGSKSYHEVHPSKAFAALNHHNSLWNTKSARIVSGKEAEAVKTSKMKKEEVELDEAVQVNKKNYSWGKMITVRHGSSHSFPLHPEHQEKIKNLKDGESTAFKDETGSHVTASREGDKVHLKLRGVNQKTTVAHSHFTESIDYSKEKPNKYVIYKHKDKYGVSQDVGTGYNWDHSYHHGYHDTVDAAKAWAAKHAGKYPHKIEVKEEAHRFDEAKTEQIDELKVPSKMQKAKFWLAHGKTPRQAASTEKSYAASKSSDSLERLKIGRTSDNAYKKGEKPKDDKSVMYGSPAHMQIRAIDRELKRRNEEVDQIDEISKSTLGSYATKALHRGDIAARMSRSDSDEMGKIANKRTTGVKKAVDRLTGKKTAASIKSNIDKAREAARNRGTDGDDEGKAYYAAQKGISKIREEVELEENFKEGDKVSFTTDYGTKQKGVITNPHTRTVKGKSHAEVRVGLSPNTWSRVHVPHHRLEKVSEEVEQIDEISTELKKRYVEKGAEDVVDRFTGRGKYERPRNPAHFTKTGRPKKSALNSPYAVKYRAKLDNRRDIVNKVSQEVHGKKRFGEEVVLDEGYNDPEYIRRAIPALRNAVDFHKELSHEHDKKSTSGSPEYVRAHSAAAKAHREAAERHKIAHAQLSHGSKDVEYYVKPARELGAYAEKLSAKANALKEEAEINEASDLRITKIYNKWPKKATYAVHTPDRKYFKEFDSMEDAKAHHAEKTSK